MTYNSVWDWMTAHPIWATLAIVAGLLILLIVFGGILEATKRYRAHPWYFILVLIVASSTLSGLERIYFFVFFLGLLTAFAEILGKFADEPIKALRTPHALCYHAFNGLNAMLALYVLQVMGVPNGTETDKVQIVAIAGLGSMMVMRSKLFSVKIGDKEVSVGPDQIIKTF